MKRFKHTKRSGFAFVLFSPFTLFILSWVMLAHARKEVNSMTEGRPEYKKSMPYIASVLLGIITLWIVPFVWISNLAGKIRRLSIEHGVEGKLVSGTWMVMWLLFGSLIIIGPFVAFIRFFRTLNRLEQKLNEEMDIVAAIEAAPQNAPAEENKEEAPAEENKEAPANEENLPAEKKDQPKVIVEVKPAVEEDRPAEQPAQEQPAEDEPMVIEYLPPEKRHYRVESDYVIDDTRVRMAANKKAIRYFETKDEAIAYAKGLAKARKVNVIVKK